MLYVLLGTVILLAILIKYRRERRKSRLIAIDGQVVLITGCDSGLGLQIAQDFYSLGLTVIATCLYDKSDGAQHLRSSLFPNRARMWVTQLDVTKSQSIEQCHSFVQQVLKETAKKGEAGKINKENMLMNLNDLSASGLWALVNNSGVCVSGEFEWLTSEQIDRQISVNFRGPIAMCKSFLPLIRKVKGEWADKVADRSLIQLSPRQVALSTWAVSMEHVHTLVSQFTVARNTPWKD